jgi:hypothetical protein
VVGDGESVGVAAGEVWGEAINEDAVAVSAGPELAASCVHPHVKSSARRIIETWPGNGLSLPMASQICMDGAPKTYATALPSAQRPSASLSVLVLAGWLAGAYRS